MKIGKFLSSPGAKILASASLLLIASRLLDWHDVADAAARLDVWHLVLATAAALSVLLFLAARWVLMAREIDARQPIRHFRHFLFAICISSITPANIGADLYRFATLRGAGKNWSIIGLLVQEKVLLLTGYLLCIVGTIAIARIDGGAAVDRNRALLLAIGGMAALCAAIPFVLPSMVAFLSRRHFLAGRPERLLDGFQRLIALGVPGRYLPLLALSLLSIMSWLATVTAIAARLDLTLPLPLVWFIAIVADIVRWAPISLQGIGVREAAFAAMFLFFGADPAQGFALGGIAYLIVTFAMLAAGGLALVIDLVTTVMDRGGVERPGS